MRRVVVTNDSTGASTVAADETFTAEAVTPGVSIRGCELWVTDAMPVDNSAEAAADQQIGSLKRFHNLYVRNGAGSAFRVTEFPAGAPRVFHRTETVDYDLVLSGEIDLEVDNGETVHLQAGDSVVVRGALHAWNNRSSDSAAVAFIMIDAKPVVVNGEELGQHYRRTRHRSADPTAPWMPPRGVRIKRSAVAACRRSALREPTVQQG